MADEIAQVVQTEIEGVKLVFKGSVQAVSWILRAIAAILKFKEEHEEKKEKKKELKEEERMNKKGKHEIKDIWKISDSQPEVIMIDAKDLDAVTDAASKAGLRFSYLPDFNNYDGEVPVLVPSQDAAYFANIKKAYVDKEIAKKKNLLIEIDDQLAELKEKLAGKNILNHKSLKINIENLEQARDETQKYMDSKQKSADGGAITFNDYLRQSTGTEFEKDPEKAMAEYEMGVEMGPAMSARDCFQPIRSKVLMPDSKVCFYVAEDGITIKREFDLDKDGLVYSTYTFKNEKGEPYKFTDNHFKGKDMTKEMWNKDNKLGLPHLLDMAQILGDTPCRIFDSEESVETYKKYHDNTPIPSEVKLAEGAAPDFSSAEAEKEIRTAMNEMLKSRASAKVNEDEVHILIHAENMFQRDGKVSVQAGDSIYQFEHILPNVAEKDGDYIIAIKKDEKVTVLDNDGNEKKISAIRARDEISAAWQMEKGNTASRMEGANRQSASMKGK